MKKMKKITALFLMILLVLPFSVKATEKSCESVSSYYTGETLYVFIESGTEEIPHEASLLLNNATVDIASPEIVGDSQVPLHYLLLIDLSTSMEYYMDEISAFAEAVFTDTANPISVTICGFGDRFEVISENLTSQNEVRQAINSLSCNHDATNFRMGVVNALQYLSNTPIEDGCISSLVVISDGVPWPNLSAEQFDEDAAAIVSAVSETSEVIMHSITLGSNANNVFHTALTSGTGISASVQNTQQAKTAGENVSGFLKNLSVLKFSPNLSFSEPRFSGQIFFQDENLEETFFLSLDNIRNFPIEIPVETTEEGENTEPSYEPEPTLESEPEPESGTQNTGESPQEEGTQGETVFSSEDDTTVFPDKTEGSSPVLMWICIVLGIAVAAAVFFIVIMKKSRRKRTGNNGGITMRIEVLRGTLKTSNHMFDLKQPLYIGSDRSCDIVWKDPDMPNKCARIYLQDQTIYIESLSARVLIEGIQIHEPNRIRSGDKISICNVVFCFRF